MTEPEDFANEMRRLKHDVDIEAAHGKADDLMCKVLRELGYGKGVNIFEKMERWYS